MRKKIFIGSSKKYLVLADALKKSFSRNKEVQAVTWSDYFYSKGCQKYTYNSLLKALDEFEFAVFFITKDFALEQSKPKNISTPNIWFEVGLWMSRYGKENVLLVQERDESYNNETLFLTDLTGLQPQYWLSNDEINKSILKKTIIPEWDNLNNQNKVALKKVFIPVKDKIIDLLNDDDERIIDISTNISTRKQCYLAAKRIIEEAEEYVYSVISYEDELSDKSHPRGLLPYIEEKIKKVEKDTDFKSVDFKNYFKRWMNLANDKIAEQANQILTDFSDKIEIRDTYCNYIEVVITENRVLLLLPSPRGHRAQVGKGILIKSKKLAKEFTDWFIHYLPEPNEIVIDSAAKLKDYRNFEWDIMNKRNGDMIDRCNSCFTKWGNQNTIIMDALKKANLK